MRTHAKALAAGCLAALTCSLAFAQVGPTNLVNPPAPEPVAHNSQPSRSSPTNAIIDPSGSLNTNRLPAFTNAPTPLKNDSDNRPALSPNPQKNLGKLNL